MSSFAETADVEDESRSELRSARPANAYDGLEFRGATLGIRSADKSFAANLESFAWATCLAGNCGEYLPVYR